MNNDGLPTEPFPRNEPIPSCLPSIWRPSPASVDEWLLDGYLARFIVEVAEGLDLSRLEKVCMVL
jgi:hypothetical protein